MDVYTQPLRAAGTPTHSPSRATRLKNHETISVTKEQKRNSFIPTLAVTSTTRYEGNLLNRLSLNGFIFHTIGFLVPKA